MKEKELEKRIEEYRKLGSEDKKVDVAGLMLGAMQNQQANMLSSRQKRIGFLVSLALPPVGVFYAVRFYLSGKDDGRLAALVCIVLTVFSVFLGWFFISVIFSGSTSDLQQIEQVRPEDIYDLYR